MVVVVEKSTSELQARLQSWRNRKASSGKVNYSSAERNPMTIQAEEIQPLDPSRSITPTKQRQTSEERKARARKLVKVGVEHHKHGEFEQAVHVFQEALMLETQLYGRDHPIVAHTQSNLGSVYLRQGRLHLAEEALQISLEVKEQARLKCETESEKQAIIISDVLNNLGNLAYLQGNYTKSMQFYRQNLKELRKRGAPDTDLANTLHNIGRLHIIRQEWDAASTILAQCQKVEEALFGPKSPQLADTLELIGYIHLTHKSFDNAMIAFSDALSIHQRNLGAVHENVATALLNVAMVMEGQGNVKHACQTYETARDVFREIEVDEKHSGFLAAARGYANLKAQLRSEKKKGEREKYASEFDGFADAERDERESVYLHDSYGGPSEGRDQEE